MKKYILLSTFTILLPTFVFATKPITKDSLLKKVIQHVVNIDDITNQLSVFVVNHLKTTEKLGSSNWNTINNHLYKIGLQMDSLQDIPLYDSLKTTDQHNFRSADNNFHDQYVLMDSTLNPLSGYTNKILYAVQIDYVEERIDHFLTVTGNFKLYLQSLIPNTPAKNIDWGKLIDSLLKKNMPVCKTDTCCNIVKGLKKTADSLLRIEKSQTDNTPYKQYVQASAYTGNVFGVAYFHHIGKPGKAKENNYIGFEFVVPASSTVVGKPGGFLMYGLSEGKLLLQAGIGYLTINPTINNISVSSLTPDGSQTPQTTLSGSAVSTQNRENISWKAAALYSPHKLGLGVSYSPLTKAGVQLSYRW
ncbi:hypothetical protein [Mucilaginibacter dorajii]|uniref:Uncharacterized protein n=1 Tax=Mucilaginibacter dorajii TaxID=692994 RepID=A0ABP7Q393_9SPHI|nr:hypothetical protein [Mucilaginibacter dorajii]MCS3732797.1 hypothetical protein [Mucilaginibacter dorajii]